MSNALSPMRVISLWQPYASLMAIGVKRFETRGFATKIRGEFGIHATQKKPSDVLKWVSNDVIFAMGKAFGVTEKRREPVLKFLDSLPRGAIVATSNLIGCYEIFANPINKTICIFDEKGSSMARAIDGRSNEFYFGDWRQGRFAWETKDTIQLEEPIFTAGSQGWWSYKGEGAGK